jgi:hypothetical protein
MNMTLLTLYLNMGDIFDFRVEFIPQGYVPLHIEAGGLVNLKPLTKSIDVIKLSRGALTLELYSLKPNSIYINANSFPQKSGYDVFFMELANLCKSLHFKLESVPHHLSESNRLARTKATIKAYESGCDISNIGTNSAQLIGFLPRFLLKSYGGDLKYLGEPTHTHIKLSIKGRSVLKIAATLVDKLPVRLKVVILKKAYNSLAKYINPLLGT